MSYQKLNELVIENDLCMDCGSCVAACPDNDLEMIDEKPQNPKTKCNHVEVTAACPRIFLDDDFNKKSVDAQKFHPFVGKYSDIFVGKTKNKDVLKVASGGGVVSTILINSIEKGLIDGTTVVDYNKKKPWEPIVKIVKTKKEIIKAAQSKYIIVPMNPVFRELVKQKGKFAVVLLPCQVQGLKKILKMNNAFAQKLKKRIGLVIALFCANNNHFDMTQFMFDKLNVKKENVSGINFRVTNIPGASQTGGFFVKLKNGQEKYFDKEYYNFLRHFFMMKGCKYCTDLTGEYADISVGDMWLSKYRDGNELPAMLITRTKRGKKFLEAAKNLIDFKKIPLNDLIECQIDSFLDRKFRTFQRLERKAKKGQFITKYKIDRVKPGLELYNGWKVKQADNGWIMSRIESIWEFLHNLKDSSTGRFFLKIIPLKVWHFFIHYFYRITYFVLRRKILTRD